MLARHRDPRIVPLELWDLIVDGAPLYRHHRDADFGAALARGVESLIDGVAVSDSGARFPAACSELRQVVLVGGPASAVRWASARIPAEHAEDPEGWAERGGEAILARPGARGLVVDLGQSRLKISGAPPRVNDRHSARIPVTPRPVTATGRAELITFVAAALREPADDELSAEIGGDDDAAPLADDVAEVAAEVVPAAVQSEAAGGTAETEAADPAEAPGPRRILDAQADEDAAVSRLMAQANSATDGEDTRRRQSALAHLKAAVAATEADRADLDYEAPKVEANLDPYRDDLAEAIQPDKMPEPPAAPEASRAASR